MSDETFAASTSNEPSSALTPTDADYDAICAAVMETVRGRWFLSEYSRRNRHADTELVLSALDRIEATLRGERTPQSIDRFRHDLVEMAKAIALTKHEIAAIGAGATGSDNIAGGTEQLDSVVTATEQATSGILAAAEQIQEVAWTMREQGTDTSLCDQLEARASDIYTACSDLTGQRTQKVVQVMRYLEGRINEMIDIWELEPVRTNNAELPDYTHNGMLGRAEDLAPPDIESGLTRATPPDRTLLENASLTNGAAANSLGVDHLNGGEHGTANGHLLIDQPIYPLGLVSETPGHGSFSGAEQHGTPTDTDPLTVPRGPRASDPHVLGSYSDLMALVFPVGTDGEPLALRAHEQSSAPVVVISEPTPHSGPVVVTPEMPWAKTNQAMTAPALESVIVISDHGEAATPARSDNFESSVPDFFALHVERSFMPPSVALTSEDTAADPTGIAAAISDPASMTLSGKSPATNRHSPLVLDLEPLTVPVSPDVTTSAPIAREPFAAPGPRTHAETYIEDRSNAIAPPTPMTPSMANTRTAPSQNTDSAPSPASAANASNHTISSVTVASERPPQTAAKIAEKAWSRTAAATSPVPTSPMPEVKVVQPTSPSPPIDPLAAIAALSSEEKIALFS